MSKKNPLPFKPAIQAVHPYLPGKPIGEVQRELGLKHVVKLASNENPLGPSPKAVKAVSRALRELHLYPDGGNFHLSQALARVLKVPQNYLVIGNGSNEIIELLARGFISSGDEVLSSEGTFLVYPILTQVCGARYVTVPMKHYCYDLESMLKKITSRTRLIFIANPNNPTGTYVSKKQVASFLKKVPERVMVCFDEAYYDFVNVKDFPNIQHEIMTGKKNICILRTFSKAYGLAGLRIGYGIFHPDTAGYLHKIRQPFNVNSLAQTAALASLNDRAFLKRTQVLIFSGRKWLGAELKKLGLTYLESQANFILFDSGHDGDEVFRALLERGVIVRSMKSYGFKTWIRVTVGLDPENRKFLKEFKAYLSSR